MKKIKYMILTMGVLLGFGLATVPCMVGAVTNTALDSACSGDAADTAVCKDRATDNVPTFIKTLVNTLLYILGAVSIIVIILSGIFYAVSGGDSSQVTRAKNTLLYAVVGLAVAVLSYAIVNYVITTFK
ncbi:MAG: pilin [Candidatus Saccharibacteria bacterium]